MEKYFVGISSAPAICAFRAGQYRRSAGNARAPADDIPTDASRSDPSEPAGQSGQMQLSSTTLGRCSPTYHFDARYARTFLPNYVHRVYLADNELLLVSFKVGALEPNRIATQTMMAAGGGLLPALVGWCMAGDARDQLTKMNSLLAGADQARVRQYLAETRQGFTMSQHDVKSAVLERPGFFDFAGGDCKAILRLKHAQRGEMTFHLLTDDDMATAATELVACLGERMKCKV